MRFGRLMCFLQSLRPHFLCRHSDRKFARSPPKRVASVVRCSCKKMGKETFCWLKNLWLTVRSYSTLRLFCNDRICWISRFCLADNSSQILKGKNWTFSFYDYKPERLKSWKLRLDNIKTEFQTLLVSRLKLVFDSWKRKRNEKTFVLVDFVR